MSIISKIRKKVIGKDYEFAIPHFFEEMAADDLTFEDIKNAVRTGSVNRKFKRDPRGTRYEVTGQSINGREISIICRIKITGKLLFITVYVI